MALAPRLVQVGESGGGRRDVADDRSEPAQGTPASQGRERHSRGGQLEAGTVVGRAGLREARGRWAGEARGRTGLGVFKDVKGPGCWEALRARVLRLPLRRAMAGPAKEPDGVTESGQGHQGVFDGRPACDSEGVQTPSLCRGHTEDTGP